MRWVGHEFQLMDFPHDDRHTALGMLASILQTRDVMIADRDTARFQMCAYVQNIHGVFIDHCVESTGYGSLFYAAYAQLTEYFETADAKC
jgi:hypothetical protein